LYNYYFLSIFFFSWDYFAIVNANDKDVVMDQTNGLSEFSRRLFGHIREKKTHTCLVVQLLFFVYFFFFLGLFCNCECK
jgi:hypothetical protein